MMFRNKNIKVGWKVFRWADSLSCRVPLNFYTDLKYPYGEWISRKRGTGPFSLFDTVYNANIFRTLNGCGNVLKIEYIESKDIFEYVSSYNERVVFADKFRIITPLIFS